MTLRKTKIVCTLGPSTEKDEVLRELILSGMNVARLNFSHGSHEYHLENIQRVRRMSQELNKPIAIMLDTKGPEIRLETFENGKVELKKGQTFTLVTKSIVGNAERASITYPELPRDIKVGNTILMDDGLVGMTVRNVTATEITCIVENDGVISNRKSVNVPDVALSMPFISPEDRADILFGHLLHHKLAHALALHEQLDGLIHRLHPPQSLPCHLLILLFHKLYQYMGPQHKSFRNHRSYLDSLENLINYLCILGPLIE